MKAEPEVENLGVDFENRSKFATIEEGLENDVVLSEEKSAIAVLEKENDYEDFEDYGNNKENDEPPSDKKSIEMFVLSDKNSSNQVSKKVIDTIFNGIPKMELPPINTIANAKNRRIIITICTIFINCFIF